MPQQLSSSAMQVPRGHRHTPPACYSASSAFHRFLPQGSQGHLALHRPFRQNSAGTPTRARLQVAIRWATGSGRGPAGSAGTPLGTSA